MTKYELVPYRGDIKKRINGEDILIYEAAYIYYNDIDDIFIAMRDKDSSCSFPEYVKFISFCLEPENFTKEEGEKTEKDFEKLKFRYTTNPKEGEIYLDENSIIRNTEYIKKQKENKKNR